MKSAYALDVALDDKYTMIINTLTGTVDVLPSTLWAELSSGTSTGAKEVEYLEKRGYLLRSEKDEQDPNLKFKFRDRFPKPRFGAILTYQCNLDCSYCILQHLKDRRQAYSRQTMTEDMIDKMLWSVDSIRTQNGTSRKEIFEITGGEPLLPQNRPVFEHLVRRISEREWRFVLISNGTYLSEWASWLNKQDALLAIQLDLDGVRKVHDSRRPMKSGKGSFSKIIEGIESLEGMRIEAHVKATIDDTSIDYLPLLANFIILRGWHERRNLHFHIDIAVSGRGNERGLQYDTEIIGKVISLFRNSPEVREVFSIFVPWRTGMLARLLRGDRAYPLFSGCRGSPYLFDPMGDIYPCSRVAGESSCRIGKYYPDFKIETKKSRKFLERSIFTLRKCIDCRYSLLCGGGCPADAWSYCGKITSHMCPDWGFIVAKWVPFYYNSVKDSGFDSRATE